MFPIKMHLVKMLRNLKKLYKNVLKNVKPASQEFARYANNSLASASMKSSARLQLIAQKEVYF
jgi:hypothetical protein